MNFQETTEYLYNQLSVYQTVGGKAYKEGLDNSLALDTLFDYPHKKYKTIHIAGTNGKGSTSHLLAAILQKSGYRVGLYTSPHLVDYRERIRVDGNKISEQYVVDFVEDYRDDFELIQPSFFELTMMMAFKYFADCHVDVAIIEVGLGGRLDSTNIITPDLCIITNISKDHVQFLGDTLPKIAAEKAGIMKPNVPTVIGEASSDVRIVFEKTAARVGAPVFFAADENIILSYEHQNNTFIYKTSDYSNLIGELNGDAQMKNTATVLCAIDKLKKINYNISSKAVYDGFAHVTELTGLMGRWQTIKGVDRRIICDTAHNVGGMYYVVKQLMHEQYKQLHFILGMVNDKDIRSVLELLPKNATYYFTRASIERALNENDLSDMAHEFGLRGDRYSTVESAVLAARELSDSDDLIFIGGSNFIVADALKLLINID